MNTHGHTVEGWRKIRNNYEKQQRQRHPEKYKAKMRRKYLKHRVEVLARQAMYRAANREKVLEAKKKWQRDNWAHRQKYVRKHYVKNRAKYITASKTRYHANKSELLTRQKRYRKSLPPKEVSRQREVKRQWGIANRERLRPSQVAATVKRRALKLSATVAGDKAEEWIIEVKNRSVVTCYYCERKLPGKDCHIDHILALTKQGKHCVANLCTSCQWCNLSKGNRLIPNWEKAGQQILSL